jgi:hypothetical protein
MRTRQGPSSLRTAAGVVLTALIGSAEGCGRPPKLADGPIELSEGPTTVRFVQPVAAHGQSWEICFEFQLPGASHHAASIRSVLVSASGDRAPIRTETLDRRGESTVCQIGSTDRQQSEAGAVYEFVELSSDVRLRLRGIRRGSRL